MNVVLLRGVNVGGHKTFRPSVLAQDLKRLNVVNIGAAGTFVVREPIAVPDLRAEFAKRLPFETEIMICNNRDIRRLMRTDAFRDDPPSADITRFVSLMSRAPREAPTPPLNFPASGKWDLKVLACDGRFIIGVYRRQMRAIDYLGRLDRVFGVSLTTRSWNTIGAIAKVLDARP